MKINGTKTGENLMKAFAGESQARNRYTYFAAQAKKEGFVQISAVFEETAHQESEHAKRFFKFMDGGDQQITAAFPFGTIGKTLDNLKAAAAGENHEWSGLYPEFAKTARAEGLPEVAEAFESIAIAEKYHEARYNALAANVAAGKVFKKDKSVTWRCRNCGYTHAGESALDKCPACNHPVAHFEMLTEKFD